MTRTGFDPFSVAAPSRCTLDRVFEGFSTSLVVQAHLLGV